MAGLFRAPSINMPPPTAAAGTSAAMSSETSPPSVATPAVQAAADAARMKERAASGSAATMLTSPGRVSTSGRARTMLSEDDMQPTVATKKLLGQ